MCVLCCFFCAAYHPASAQSTQQDCLQAKCLLEEALAQSRRNANSDARLLFLASYATGQVLLGDTKAAARTLAAADMLLKHNQDLDIRAEYQALVVPPLLALGRDEEAKYSLRMAQRRALEVEDPALGVFLYAPILLAAIDLGEAEISADALVYLERHHREFESQPRAMMHGFLSIAYARLGMKDEAHSHFIKARELADIIELEGFVSISALADLYALLTEASLHQHDAYLVHKDFLRALDAVRIIDDDIQRSYLLTYIAISKAKAEQVIQ